MTDDPAGQPSELWSNAPPLLEALDGIGSRPKEDVKRDVLSLLGLGGSSVPTESFPSAEDFEYSLVNVVLSRLESVSELEDCEPDSDAVVQVIDVLDVASSVVEELFRNYTSPGAAKEDTEKCRQWWITFFNIAEDVARVAPAQLLYSLVDNLEVKLERLRAAYLQMASVRLADLDAKKADQEAARAGKEEKPKIASEEEPRRLEERKKAIVHLGISPNGQLYLAITSLLKQLSTRLPGTSHAMLRARVSLLLERLLAMDHKAIANNQKLRNQDFYRLQELDPGAEAVFTAKATASAGAGPPGRLSDDPAVDYPFFRTFWNLQEALQHPERLFDKPEGWNTFHKAVTKILQLFLKYPVKDAGKQPWHPPEPIPLRHAPCAKSLGVQLDDPGFRLQFVAQVAIAVQALEQDGNLRRTDKMIARQSEAVRADMSSLKKMCESAGDAAQTGFSSLLRHVVEREAHWVAWKMHGCREFERDSLELLNAKTTPCDVLRSGLSSTRQKTKPALPGFLGKVLNALKDSQWKAAGVASAANEGEAKTTRLHSMHRLCDANLDRLIEDDKPENGIEEEYKAKRNKVFMWQVRRLFGQQHLRVYSQKEMSTKQDFMDFVYAVRGKPIAPASAGAGARTAAQPGAGDVAEGAVTQDAEDAVGRPEGVFVEPNGEAVAETSEAVAEAAPEEDDGIAVSAVEAGAAEAGCEVDAVVPELETAALADAYGGCATAEVDVVVESVGELDAQDAMEAVPDDDVAEAVEPDHGLKRAAEEVGDLDEPPAKKPNV